MKVLTAYLRLMKEKIVNNFISASSLLILVMYASAQRLNHVCAQILMTSSAVNVAAEV
jgi:hypothetical protein